MTYDIQSENDFITGPYLVVRVPEDKVDYHALYTIQTDCPDFIVPFNHKSINGQVELVYKTGSQSKLQYFSGELSPREYAELWKSLLEPLLECGDWFMAPDSFVMNTDYLFYDKNNKSIKYVYIPSTERNPENNEFIELAVDVSKMMTVSDAALENKVLRAIIKDFNPVGFLGMLKDHVSEKNVKTGSISYAEMSRDSRAFEAMEVSESLNSAWDHKEDIVVDIRSSKKEEQNAGDVASRGYRFFGGKRKKETKPNIMQPTPLPVIIKNDKKVEPVEFTQNISFVTDGSGLRYIGRSSLPPFIQILIEDGQIFTVGRFDAAVGKKQSNFEFDKKTKAVSRRHAAIERDDEGYKIIDLSSSAGTFVNDKKLQPNTPVRLEAGNRVSFGNSGADYVWEVS